MVRTLQDEDLDDGDRRLLGNIDQHGWAVIKIPSVDETPGWAFSIGMHHTLQHPEIVIFGLSMDLAHGVINSIGDEVRKGKVYDTDERYPGLLDGVDCAFRTVQPCWYEPFLGYANWYYQGINYPVLQLIWPDKKDLLPWEDGFKPEWLLAQPLLFETDPVEARVVELLRSMETEE